MERYYEPVYMQAIKEHFDLRDRETRKILLSLTEAEGGKVLESLTGRLYQMIIDKVDDIDFGLIPQSKGDITKVDGVEKLLEALQIISDIMVSAHQDKGIEIVQTDIDCIKNIQVRTDLFQKAYALNLEIPITIYNTMVLAVFDATSYMIVNTIDFIKDPGTNSFEAVVVNNNIKKTKQSLVMKNIISFNEACRKGDIDKTIQSIIDAKARGFAVSTIGVSIVAAGTLLTLIIPIIRELIYLYYHARVSMNDYLTVQADLIQMNITGLELNDSIDQEKRERIIKKQASIAERLRKLANVIEVKEKKAENKTISTINSENRQYKFNEIQDELPDSAVASLF